MSSFANSFGAGFDENYSMSASQFGNLGSGGGGFNNGFLSSQSPQKRMNDSRVDTIIPVTVRQIHKCEVCPDGTFQIDGVPAHQVSLVVRILTINMLETKIDFTVDDGTGTIELAKWIPSTSTTDQKEREMRFHEHTYVRVFGSLRKFEDQISILVFNMRPVEDFNEVTYHMLECISVHKYHTKKSTAAVSYTHQQMDHLTISHDPNSDNFTPVQRDVLNSARRANGNDIGASVAQIIHECKGYSEYEIRRAIQDLTTEGHLYSTVDEEHYKVTN